MTSQGIVAFDFVLLTSLANNPSFASRPLSVPPLASTSSGTAALVLQARIRRLTVLQAGLLPSSRWCKPAVAGSSAAQGGRQLQQLRAWECKLSLPASMPPLLRCRELQHPSGYGHPPSARKYRPAGEKLQVRWRH